MKARIIETGRIVNVCKDDFNNDGITIYREIGSSREWLEFELDFDVCCITKFVKSILRFILCI